MAAKRFVQYLKDVCYENYEKLLEEINRYRISLCMMNSSDISLMSALDEVRDNCLQEIRRNNRKRKAASLEPQHCKKVKIENYEKKYTCSCGKSYKHRQNLHRHRKTCTALSVSQTSLPQTGRGNKISTAANAHNVQDENRHTKRQSTLMSGPQPTPLSTRPLSPPRPPPRSLSPARAYPPSSPSSVASLLASSQMQENYSQLQPVDDNEKENRPTASSTRTVSSTSALNNSVQKIEIHPTRDEKDDLLLFYAKVRSQVHNVLNNRRKDLRDVKFYLNSRVKMARNLDQDGDKETVPHFRSKTKVALENDDLDHDVNSAFQEMTNNMEEFINKGSDWRFDEVVSMEIVTVPYQLLGGSSYLPLPVELRGIRSVINVKNDDQKCFLWSILAACHPAPHNAERLNHYTAFKSEFNMSGIAYPVTINSIPKFEKQNGISVNVFGFEDKQVFPLYVTKMDISRLSVDLLYIRDGEKTHYCMIKDLDKFSTKTKKAKIKHYFCRQCLHGFTQHALLLEHQPYCNQFNFQRVVFPKEGRNDVLEFQSFHKQLRVPFVIYCDLETLVEKIDTCYPDATKSSTTKESHFEPCGYAYKVVCTNEKYTKPPVLYHGRNAIQRLLKALQEEEDQIKFILSQNEPLIMNEMTEEEFQKAEFCHICDRKFDSKSIKVRDHYHIGLTRNETMSSYSNYRGAAHSHCNLSHRESSFIPIVMHNLRGFDSHLLCQAVGQFKKEKIKCIAQNMNSYLSLSLGDLRFIDSFQFMSESLETLVDNLVEKEGINAFNHFRCMFPNEEIMKLLLRKNVFCYEYLDTFDKFNERQLPAQDAFYSSLKKEHICDDDYHQVQEVWRKINMHTLGDLHDNYVITDVLLLADVFETFRDMTLKHYHLDACHYFTAPGLAWDAALRMTNIKLDLITDPNMYMFFECGLRGGVSMISKRQASANHPGVQNYDSTRPNKHLIYYDLNNLYGGIMRMPLPIGMMRWLTEEEIARFHESLLTLPEDGAHGFTIECDLEYPDEIHDLHNCYPLAPEHKIVTEEELSPYNKALWNKLHPVEDENKRPKKIQFCKKLIPTLENKVAYIVHYRNLQFYLKHGMKLKKIYRVLEYRQEPWLKPYIDFNTRMRQNAKSEFEKAFFKLIVNAVFGKMLEILRNRVNIKLIQNEKMLRKYCAKPSFQRLQIFNEDLVGVENSKVTLLLNKPIYVGQTILDLAKLVMYQYHYDFIKREYGERAELLFTDTDSLLYEIETEDVYKDIAQNQDLYDLSNYPPNHFLYNQTNKKVVLKMKDECGGVPIRNFIGLRSKMYSIKLEDSSEKRTAKGISKSVIRKHLSHDLYEKTLRHREKLMSEMTLIRSDNHKLYTERINKVGLCGFDDKRYIRDCGIRSFAYGHFAIRDEVNVNILNQLEN
ncbi:hypothetical protein FSP39_012926 [Pinctada imbricata]|uniref:DNA-directed DNA polymerase n=1 Tax=Pinctada imbricata TaxID=66713 RepID=A0AA88YLK3_PINIB|nr:hypothetical protein FSP39_012926 [Pinctada imbricata]